MEIIAIRAVISIIVTVAIISLVARKRPKVNKATGLPLDK